MNDKYLGIILKQNDYKENDALISVLLKGLGKFSFSCRGVRKLTSKNSMNIRPFLSSEILFDYNENKTIFSLKNANTVKNRRHINEDIVKMSLASLVCQIVDVTILNDDEYIIDDVFEMLDFILDRVNDDKHEILATCLFISLYLKLLGIKPNVDECALCGNTKIIGISLEEGGFVCGDCANKAVLYKNIDIENIRKFRIINKAELINYKKLKEIDNYNKTDLNILVRFFEFHSGIKLKSYEFVSSIL